MLHSCSYFSLNIMIRFSAILSGTTKMLQKTLDFIDLIHRKFISQILSEVTRIYCIDWQYKPRIETKISVSNLNLSER